MRDDAPRRHTRLAEPAVELEREVDVRELGLPVGPPRVVAAVEVGVRRVDRPSRVPPGAGDRDDAHVVACEQCRQEQRGEREVPEMVHAELHLEAVLGPALGDALDPRVVHEDVDPGM